MSTSDNPSESAVAAEAEYRRLLDRSLVPVCIHDGTAVRYVNPAAVRALGAESSADIVDRPMVDFIRPTSQGGVRDRLAELREDGDVSPPSAVSLVRVDGTELVAQAVAAVRLSDGTPTYEVIFRDPIPVRTPLVPDPATDEGPTEATVTTNLDGIVTRWEDDAHALYGRSAHEVVGLPIQRAVGAPLDPADLARTGKREFTTHYDAAGGPLPVRLLVIRTAAEFVIVCETVDAGERDEQKLRSVLDLLHDGVVIIAPDGRFQFTNKAARQILRSDADDLVGRHLSSRAVDLPMYNVRGRKITNESHPLRWILKTGQSLGGDVVGVDRVDGTRIWVTGHGCLMDPDDPQNSSVLLSFTDITEHYDAQERLQHEATHDGLTGLPNRGHALGRATQMLADTGAGRLSAVLFIDLDRLKAVNDSHGHPIGDDVLRCVAQRMRAVARPADLVARIGGDEFVVLLTGAVDDVELDAIATRMHNVLAEDIVVGSLSLRVGASIGITTLGADDTRSIAEVLRDADVAMYRAKAKGRANTAHFEPSRSDPSQVGD